MEPLAFTMTVPRLGVLTPVTTRGSPSASEQAVFNVTEPPVMTVPAISLQAGGTLPARMTLIVTVAAVDGPLSETLASLLQVPLSAV